MRGDTPDSEPGQLGVGYVAQLTEIPVRKKKHPIGFAPPAAPSQKKAGERHGK